jgi:8-oxo-dGTP pyrophosphatase MutT (NUDIX family)
VADELHDVRRALARPGIRIEDPSLRRSAVAILLSPGRRVWFVRRAERTGDPWSGHLAFPGGREQPDDGDLLRTATRETEEEVGLDLRGAELLGELDDLRTRPIRTMMIRPYLFRLDHEPTLGTSDEVAGSHSLSLDHLLEGHGRGTMRWPVDAVGVTLPRVDFDGVRLWGLTLAMVDDLLDRIDGRGQGLARPTR